MRFKVNIVILKAVHCVLVWRRFEDIQNTVEFNWVMSINSNLFNLDIQLLEKSGRCWCGDIKYVLLHLLFHKAFGISIISVIKKYRRLELPRSNANVNWWILNGQVHWVDFVRSPYQRSFGRTYIKHSSKWLVYLWIALCPVKTSATNFFVDFLI